MSGTLQQIRKAAVGAVLALGLLVVPATADAFNVKTNRGGLCKLSPLTSVQGDQTTYGLQSNSCEARNGIKRIASTGLAIEGRVIVSKLPRKFGVAPYKNVTTSDRTEPDGGSIGVLPDIPILPNLPPVPDVPGVPIEIPALPELPLPDADGDDGPSDVESTYNRIDFSVQLNKDKGKKQKRKPERWRKQDGCVRASTKQTNDTLICQFFAPTGVSTD